MEKVTVYIPCYNAERYLKDCLEAVLQQTYSPDEVLVIDDGSTDHTAEIASRYPDPVRVIQHQKNKGLAAARNTAVLNSRNEWIASVDADVVPAQDWLEKLVERIRGDAIAGAGGKLIERFQRKLADRWRASHMAQNWGDNPNEEPSSLFGSNTLFKVSAIKGVGLYNEVFRTNYEDVDLCLRLLKRGFRLYYTPHAVCYHLREDTIRSVLRTWWGWNSPVWREKAATLRVLQWKLRMNWRLSLRFLVSDAHRLEWQLLGMDLLSLFYTSYADLCYYIRHRGHKETLQKES
jgi:GT2 family glycosyltransferase